MLYTSCILNDNSFGTRISVMSRHTLNDGKTPDERITENSYDEWCKILAPSDSLIGNYYGGQVFWDTFSVLYTAEIQEGEKKTAVEKLALRAMREDVTILCIEDTHERCHRSLLARECQRYLPQLEVIHR